jgi:hypothetical protein
MSFSLKSPQDINFGGTVAPAQYPIPWKMDFV